MFQRMTVRWMLGRNYRETLIKESKLTLVLPALTPYTITSPSSFKKVASFYSGLGI